MKIVKRVLFGLVVGASVVSLSSTTSVLAAAATANVTVSATVSTNCSITGGSLAFGEYDPVVTNAASPKDGSGTFSVACTKGAAGVTIDLDQGLNYSSGRRMIAGSEHVTYELYSDSGTDRVGQYQWRLDARADFSCSKAAVSYTLYGRIGGGPMSLPQLRRYRRRDRQLLGCVSWPATLFSCRRASLSWSARGGGGELQR